MKTFAEKAVKFFASLNKPKKLPGETDLINPYIKEDVRIVMSQFFKK